MDNIITIPLSTIIVYRYKLPSWAKFEIGKVAVYWKPMNGLPPTSISIKVLSYLIASYLINYLLVKKQNTNFGREKSRRFDIAIW